MSIISLPGRKKIDISGYVHTTQEKFENGVFTLKTHLIFYVHSTRWKIENATITDHFGFVFEENSGREITWLSWRHRFWNVLFSKCFPSTIKGRVQVSNPSLLFDKVRDGLDRTEGLIIEIYPDPKGFSLFFLAWDSCEKPTRVCHFAAISWIKKNLRDQGRRNTAAFSNCGNRRSRRIWHPRFPIISRDGNPPYDKITRQFFPC